MNETTKKEKRDKSGGTKYVYLPDKMVKMKHFFYTQIQEKFTDAKVLCWT